MTMTSAEQLLLNVRPRADLRLEDFAGAAFGHVLAACATLLAGPAAPCFISGEDACGRNALLTALCAEADRRGLRAMLLPLPELLDMGPELLAGLEGTDLLILDGLEALAGLRAWEEALFHLYNRALATPASRLLFAARLPVRGLDIGLPDLRSRLQQATAYALPVPDDAIRQQLLSAGAQRRGLVLLPEVERFLLERGPRSLETFINCLEQLDRLSLRDQRRLTVPFVRDVLSGLPEKTGQSDKI
jgi:DnaA family protein